MVQNLGAVMCRRLLIGTEVYDGVMCYSDGIMVRWDVLDVEPDESTVLTYRQDTCDNRKGAPDTSLIGGDTRKMSVAHNMEVRYAKRKFSLKEH
jgi:hypothetical protein